MAHTLAPLEPYRFTREQYDRMVERGALEDLPVELLEGLIVEMSPQGPEHQDMIVLLMRLLAPAVADERLHVQMPLAATDDSEPEPDLMLVAPVARGEHPRTALLAIEVAVTHPRMAYRKARIYAAARVAEYWIVDVPARTVEVFTGPQAGGYDHHRLLRAEDVLAVPGFDIRVGVGELFRRLLP